MPGFQLLNNADQYWYHSASSFQGDSNIRPDIKENG